MEVYTCNPSTQVDEAGEVLLIPSLKKKCVKSLKLGFKASFFFLITETGES